MLLLLKDFLTSYAEVTSHKDKWIPVGVGGFSDPR